MASSSASFLSAFGLADNESSLIFDPIPVTTADSLSFEPETIQPLEQCFKILAKVAQDPGSPSEENVEDDARYVLKKAYMQGDSYEKSFYEIAVLMGFYKNVPQDECILIKNKIREAALQGDLSSQINFISAILIDNPSLADTEDKTLAKELLFQTALSGCADAQYLLGKLFFEGPNDVIPANLSLGIHWLKKAVNQGDVGAHFLLGVCYQQLTPLPHHCYTVQPALLKAIELFTKALEKGYSMAGSYLETCLLELNASQGDFEAQFKLAQCYEKGIGVDVSLPKALGWYYFARELAKYNKSTYRINETQLEKLWKKEKKYCHFSAFFQGTNGSYKVEDLRQTDREKAERFVNTFAAKRHIYYFAKSFQLTPEGLTHEKLAIKTSSIDRLKSFR